MNTKRINTEEAPHSMTKAPGAAPARTFAVQSKRMREFNALLATFEEALSIEVEYGVGCGSKQATINARLALRRFVRLIR